MPQKIPYPAPGNLPENTPISNLGQLSPTELQLLTPAARTLSKGDLVELEKWVNHDPTAHPPATLTIADMNSLADAYAARLTRLGPNPASAAVACCCCCTPCCSCTAVAERNPRVR